MRAWRITSTPGACPIRTWWSVLPARCDSAISSSGSRRTPSSTARRRSGPISPMPTSMRPSPHTSGASVALERGRRRSPIEVADATKSDEPPLATPRRSNMVVRIATAAVLIAAVLAVLILGSVWVYAAIAVILGAALIEYWNLTRAMAAPAPLWLLFPLSYALLLRDRLPSWADVAFLLAAATVLGLATLVFVRAWGARLPRWALAVGGSLYLAFTLSFYLSLYFLHRPDPNHLGFGYVIAVFGAIWVGDTAAMVAGLRFGRHRFFSRISPKKTVEGAVAELVASTVFFAIVGLLLNISFPHNVILGLLIGIFAEVGDLVESQIKRTAGVKDASHLIPGHGGVLDRIDSLLLVGVVVYYYVTFLHLA